MGDWDPQHDAWSGVDDHGLWCTPDEAQLHPPKSPMLQAMYWRSEILQVMYWLRGEGFGDLVDAPMVERFLGVDAAHGIGYLQDLVRDGLVDVDGDWYRLSARGLDEGSREFALAFSELTRPAHGECSDDCWCHVSTEEALACTAARHGSHSGAERPRHEGDGRSAT
jgi:hypothetical protein